MFTGKKSAISTQISQQLVSVVGTPAYNRQDYAFQNKAYASQNKAYDL